jgi:serine protease Do
MSVIKNRVFLSAASLGAVAILTAGAGYFAHAQGESGAVNAPGKMADQDGPKSFADLVAKVAPAVVSINVVEKPESNAAALEEETPFDQGGGGSQGGGENPFGFRFMIPQSPQNMPPVRASASGFFVSPNGLLVTNNHVVEGAQKITVATNDGRSLPARVVGTDPATDLAVIKVDGGPFPYVSFEDRAQPRVGDWVVAVGNPFGLGGTATAGIVSALGRQNVSGSNYVDYMQIDAPINRGNSGGPTFDVEGHVVGVNTAIYTPSGGSVGIGFDIPANVAAQVTHELIAYGQVTRGYIGATVQSLSPELAGSLGLGSVKGAVVDQLSSGGPAQSAGLRSGDVITSIDGRTVTSSDDLTRQVALTRPGQIVHVGVLRDGRPLDVAIRSAVRPSEASLAENNTQGGQDEGPGAQAGPPMLGMQLAPDPNGGLVVQGVSPNSGAAEEGVQQGDVILRAGERPINSALDLSQAVSQAKAAGRKRVPLLVARAGQRFFVPLPISAGGEG